MVASESRFEEMAVPVGKRLRPCAAGNRQAPATALKAKYKSLDIKDLQAAKKNPPLSNNFIQTGFIINITIEIPRHHARMLCLDDWLISNGERPRTTI